MPSPARPLRVLTITHNYPRFPGDPAGAFVARIAQGAAAEGHPRRVIAPHAPGAPLEQSSAGVELRRFRYAPDRFERVAYTGNLHQSTLFSLGAALAFPGFLLSFSNAVREAVKKFEPQVIHAHWWLPGGWFASRAGVPYLVTCHGSDVRLLHRSRLFRRSARRRLGAGRPGDGGLEFSGARYSGRDHWTQERGAGHADAAGCRILSPGQA